MCCTLTKGLRVFTDRWITSDLKRLPSFSFEQRDLKNENQGKVIGVMNGDHKIIP